MAIDLSTIVIVDHRDLPAIVDQDPARVRARRDFPAGAPAARAQGPGLILVFAPMDRMVRISLRIETLEVPAQDVVTRDNVTVKVNAVIYFRGDRSAAGGDGGGELSCTPRRNWRRPRCAACWAKWNWTSCSAQREKLNVRLQSILDQHTRLGREGGDGGGEAGGPAGADDPRHRAAGGSGTRAPRQDHPRGRRVHGGGEAGAWRRR